MGPLGLIWKHRWVLLLSLLVSAGAAVPFSFDDRVTYESRGTVLVPSGDPVSLRITQTSSIEAALTSFGQGEGLEKAVRQRLGTAGDDLLSVSAVQQQSIDFYTVSATARTPSTAVAAVDAASEALIEESTRLANDQVEGLQADVARRLKPFDEQLALLTRQRADVADRVRAIEATLESLRNQRGNPPTTQDEIAATRSDLRTVQLRLERLDSEIELVESSRRGLSQLVEGAVQAQVVRETATKTLGSPSPPSSNLTRRVIENVGVPLLVGVAVAALVLVWLERRRLRASEARAPAPPTAVLGSAPSSAREGESEARRLETLEEEAIKAVAAYREAEKRTHGTTREAGGHA